ncbi:MAG: hypothetical protein Q7S52_00155 [bacterium]|nr:hypothetical protein [bacterium]
MSATEEQCKGYPKNADRKYVPSIQVRFEFHGRLDLDKLRQCMLEVECKGTWGESRIGWKWWFNPQWSKIKDDRDIRSYTIETGCSIKHSQIHAFENFVIDFMRELTAKFSGITIKAQPKFPSGVYAIE